jgi:hypothetical protein
VLPVSKISGVYDETVCEGESIAWAGMDGKTIVKLRIPFRFGYESGCVRTVRPLQREVVGAGQTIASRSQKDRQIEVVVDVGPWVVKTAVDLVTLNTVKVTRAVLTRE